MQTPDSKFVSYYRSPFGVLKIGYDNNAIFELVKTNEDYIETNDLWLAIKLKRELDEYFQKRRKIFDLPLRFIGTEFQKQVWSALLEIPYGETKSYKDIATVIGNSKASRAVGMANNKNRIMILVPCHRVIGISGKLVGYEYGLNIKKYLIDLEK